MAAVSSSVHGCPSGSNQAISPELQNEIDNHFKCCKEGCKEKYKHLSTSEKMALHKLFCSHIIFEAMRAIAVHKSKAALFKKEITPVPLSALKIDRLIEGVFDFEDVLKARNLQSINDVIPKDTDSQESKHMFAKLISDEAGHAFEALEKAEQEKTRDISWDLKLLWRVKVEFGYIQMTTSAPP